MALTVIAGPCVIEQGGSWLANIAADLKNMVLDYGPADTTLVVKASWDKANRSTRDGFRGIGLRDSLMAFRKVRETVGIPLTTDIHEPLHAHFIQDYVDVVQIPAFLARQTDLIQAAADTGLQTSIKIPPWAGINEALAIKAKYMAARLNGAAGRASTLEPWMIYRGTFTPYEGTKFHEDMFDDMAYEKTLQPFFLDVTHSNGGDKYGSISLALKAADVPVQGLFMEVHPDPMNAKCDSRHQLDYAQFKTIMMLLKHQADQRAHPV